MRLLLFPGIVEALVAGGVMVGVFGMPPLFALAVGFVIKPCDPAIVIATMCGYQERKAGVRKVRFFFFPLFSFGRGRSAFFVPRPRSAQPAPPLPLFDPSLSQGIPSLLVAAASFDDIVAIALYTVFITLAVPSSSSSSAGGGGGAGSKIWSIAAAPLQLVFGLVLGLAGAAVCSASKLFDRAILRTAAVLLCALAQVRFFFFILFPFFPFRES